MTLKNTLYITVKHDDGSESQMLNPYYVHPDENKSSLDKILYVKKKNVFGNELVYPVCKDAILFTKLLKQESLTSDDMARIKSLGYTFKHVEVKI